MPHSPFDPKKPLRQRVFKERRAPRGAPGSLRWLKSVLRRPLRMERRGLQVHILLEDRRQPAHVREAHELDALCGELRTRLLGDDHPQAEELIEHLMPVHDALVARGWGGIESLSSRVLRKAQLQTQVLLNQEHSDALEDLVARLGVLRGAAEAREDRIKRAQAEEKASPPVEVSETSHEDYEAMVELNWVTTTAPQELPSQH